MSKKKIVIISTIVLVIIIGIVLWLSTANIEASGYSYSDEYISLGYVPDGFELVQNDSSDYSVTLVFSGNGYFMLSSDSVDAQYSFDTENCTFEYLLVNDYDAVYIENPRGNILFWNDSKRSYTMTSDLTKNIMLKIAENVNR